MDRLWCDKYRPKTLELLDYHKNISTTLRKLSFCVDFPHLLFYGPNGAGKKTRVMAFLAETFGNGVFKLKQDYWEFKLSASNSAKVECTVLMSNYHIDITPSECESYDHVVLQKLIKEVVNNFQIDSNKTNQKGFKFIVINDCDKLSRAAQSALSRTMEKYSDICKLILVCENLGKIIHPLRGKCSMIRVPAPSYTDIESVLKMILKKENAYFPEEMLGKVAEMSERNLRRAILQFQTMRLKLANTASGTLDFYAPEWRSGIRHISEQIIKEQSLKTLKLIRERIYDLMVNCVPGDLIIKYLLFDLLGKVNGEVACLLIEYAACYENKLRKGSKVIFHIEGFIAKVMVVYNQYVVSQEQQQQHGNMILTQI